MYICIDAHISVSQNERRVHLFQTKCACWCVPIYLRMVTHLLAYKLYKDSFGMSVYVCICPQSLRSIYIYIYILDHLHIHTHTTQCMLTRGTPEYLDSLTAPTSSSAPSSARDYSSAREHSHYLATSSSSSTMVMRTSLTNSMSNGRADYRECLCVCAYIYPYVHTYTH